MTFFPNTVNPNIDNSPMTDVTVEREPVNNNIQFNVNINEASPAAAGNGGKLSL